MSQIIPGGRPRASSDGDILDEGLCSTLFVNLNDRNGVSRKSHQKASANVLVNSNNKHTSEYLDSGNDTFDSDGELSSHSQSSSSRSRRKGLFFTSMRKAVSRAFVKDSKPNGDSTLKRSEKTNRTTDHTKVWTPDLKHAGEERNSNNFNGNEPSDINTMSTARPLITDSNVAATVPKWKKTPGTIGIYNHGNSCFMNAVLQCLSNIDSFTEYFVKDFYKSDLKNSSNGKRGMFRSNHGEVTEQLGHLLKCLWSGKYTSEVSKEFKAVVGKFNNQYKGDHQHDAQEFLLWLLDRVHEDVSTNNKKKVKSQKAPTLKSEEELAYEAASANGESFVLKLFQALHSSTLTCPTCGERSSTFDPYLCVSLPLPQRCPRAIYVIVVSLDRHHFHEVKMAVTLNQYDGVKELRELVSTEAKIPPKQLLLVQLTEDGFGATYSDEQPISDIPENEIVYAIEAYSDDASIQSSVQEFDTPTSQLLVMHVEAAGGSARSHRFGSPVMLKVRRDITWKGLQKEILLKMEDAVCEEILSQPQLSSNLFTLRVYDGSSRKNYLPSNVDMPLYTQSAERAYTTLDEDFGPPHIKIIAEWEPQIKKTVVKDDQEHIEIDSSVTEAQNNPPGQNKVSLDECFKLYTQEEKLIGDDAWLCPHCKQQQQGTIKTLRLWSLPDVLVLHLKRFKQTGLGRSKLNTLIEFPVENLDMSAHLTHRSPTNPLKRDDYCYDLLGVSNHYGNMTGGHYIAYCRSPVDGEWREFNDAKVHILQGPIATKEAYLLFYQRRSLSKEVNQRLFTGDHWVFTLPLAPPDMIEKASEEVAPWNSEPNYQSRRSRSRSASPSAHRPNNKEGVGSITRRLPTRPLTPQPFRRPMISYTDNKGFEDDDEDDDDDSSLTSPSSPEKSNPTRRSRPVQRQVSAPGPQFRREKSAGAAFSVKLKEPSRSLYDRRSVEVDQEFTTEQSKKTSKVELTNGAARSHSQSRSKAAEKFPPQVTVIRHDPPKNNDLPLSTSKATNHQVLLSNGLESDAKYPTTSYDHTRYVDNKKGVSVFEPASALQVKFDDKDPYSTRNHKSYHDPILSESEAARKKLAQLSRVPAERAHFSIDPVEEKSNFVRIGSRVYETQKNLELAQNKTLQLDYLGNVNLSKAGTSFSNRQDSFALDSRDRDSELKRDRWYNHSLMFGNRTGYSLLEETEGDYFVNLDLSSELPTRTNIRSRMRDDTQYQGFCELAEKHFGDGERLLKDNFRNRFADDTEYHSSAYVSSHLNGDVSCLNKYATISRTSDTCQAGRHDRDNIPRSSTDHNIHYNNPSLPPPPSPTPPHSLREERTFNHAAISTSLPSTTSDYLTSSRLTSRERSSIHSYEFAGKGSGDQDILISAGARTLPGYFQSNRLNKFNFRRPRGTWGLKPPKPVQRDLGNIPSPCLRESSV